MPINIEEANIMNKKLIQSTIKIFYKASTEHKF